MAQRSNILLSFRQVVVCNLLISSCSSPQDPEFTLLLISLKAGGEGLNLQAASCVFLLGELLLLSQLYHLVLFVYSLSTYMV